MLEFSKLVLLKKNNMEHNRTQSTPKGPFFVIVSLFFSNRMLSIVLPNVWVNPKTQILQTRGLPMKEIDFLSWFAFEYETLIGFLSV